MAEMNLDPNREEYIPTASQCVLGAVGRDEFGRFRIRCNACGADRMTQADPIYGGASSDDGTACDDCGRTFGELSEIIDTAHAAQQLRWSRASRIDHVIEYGIPSQVRCRVY